jgi:hypothetical protein
MNFLMNRGISGFGIKKFTTNLMLDEVHFVNDLMDMLVMFIFELPPKNNLYLLTRYEYFNLKILLCCLMFGTFFLHFDCCSNLVL